MQSSRFEFRLRILLVLFASGFSLIWIRLFYLQVVQGENLRHIAEANRTSLVLERAPRGLILDRNGVVLADSRPTFVVLFTPLELKKEVLSNVIQRLARILNLTEEDLSHRLQPALKHSSLVRVMDRASRYTAFALAEQRPNLPGVSVVIEMQRRYPHQNLAAHVLGYLGQVNQDELEELKSEGYRSDWLIGKTGLERIYDHLLRGEHGGMRIEVNASGRSMKVLDRKEPTIGYQIKTTLDIKVQEAAEEALEETKKPGAVVALDPRTGEILAFASSPSYDPSLFVYTRGELTEQDETPAELLNRSDLPLFDRAIQGMYPPGSIFKIVGVAAALETKKVDSEETAFCPGYFWLGGPGGRKFLCWKKEGHGRMSLTDGLINSCDVYFYRLGLKVGPDPIEALARHFGLGTPTGIDLPGEKGGFVPGKSMFKTDKRRWFDGDTLNMVIGQGTILLTPIQAANLACAVASRGKVFHPTLLKEIRLPTGELYARGTTEIVKQIKLSDSTWDFLDETLSRVVEEGTGQSCKIPGVKVAGKTGTAQNPHGKDHAWFVAYAPVGNPVIALSVLVEHGVHGAVAAAPIARQVILARLSEQGQTFGQPPKASAETKGISGD